MLKNTGQVIIHRPATRIYPYRREETNRTQPYLVIYQFPVNHFEKKASQKDRGINQIS